VNFRYVSALSRGALVVMLGVLMTACSAPTPLPIPTLAQLATATATHIMTTIPPTATIRSTATPPPPTATNTRRPPTQTALPPTVTNTSTPPATPTLEIVATERPLQTIGAGSFPTPRLSPQPTNTATNSPTPVVTATPEVTSSAVPTVAPIGDASITYTNQVINVLREPALSAEIVRAVAGGDSLFLIGRAWNNEWYEVRLFDGTTGWVYGLYLVIWMTAERLAVTWQEPTRPPMAQVSGFGLGGHVMNMNADAFGIARSAGMTWIKVQHRYYHGETASSVAPLIASAHRAGFRLLLGIVGERGQVASIPNYNAAFAAFAAGAAAAGADAIEVWNEPNIDREWPRGFIHGGNYTQLLQAAYIAIKAAHPTTIVISAAPAPTGFFGPAGCGEGGCNDDIFLKQMAFAGAQNYVDCVGLHHNDGIVSPTQMSGDPRGNYPTYYLRGVISRVPFEFNSRPVCLTEVGYLSPQGYGSLPPNFGWAGSTTVAQQAQWLGEAVGVARSTGRVAIFIVWNIDFDVYTFEDPMAGYAIRRPGGSCPACDTLSAAMR